CRGWSGRTGPRPSTRRATAGGA
ncbi:MAG: hypothetical protein AVDCRST_MAG27-3354, partial [uncultured Craurococcus sp.]